MDDIIELSSGSDDYEDVMGVMENANRFFSIVVMGPPIPKPSPSFISWMRNGTLMRRVVNRAAPQMLRFKELFMTMLQDEYNLGNSPLPIYEAGPVELDITFYRKLPLTYFTASDRQRGLRNPSILNRTIPDVNVPDADNLAKFVCDAIKGVIFTDDRQIARLRLTKTFHTSPPWTGQTKVRFRRVRFALSDD